MTQPKKRISIGVFGTTRQKILDGWLTALAGEYDFVLTQNNPDYVFFLNENRFALKTRGVRIFLTGENLIPDFNVSDYAIGFNNLSFGDRYLCWPFYRWHNTADGIISAREQALTEWPMAERPGFCACVVSNLKAQHGPLAEICDSLSAYKDISYGGRWRNSTGGRVSDKHAFLGMHRFSVAFENSAYPGYTTEKIADAFKAGNIPIYWGDPDVTRDFNPEAFLHVRSAADVSEVCSQIRELDANPSALRTMSREKIFTPEGLRDFDHTRAQNFLRHIFDQPLSEAYRRNFTQWGVKHENNLVRPFFNPLGQIARLPKLWLIYWREKEHGDRPV